MLYPLYTNGLISDGLNFFFALLFGIGFGFILERGGFGSSAHIAPIFYFRDLRVAQTMVSAIMTTATLMIISVYEGWVNFDAVYIPPVYVWPYLVGGILFGLGMVMGGWCPGTSVVGMARGKVDAFMFALGLLSGMWFYFDIYDKIENFANSGALGRFTFAQLFHTDLYVAFFITVVIVVGLMTFMRTMKAIRDQKGEE